ncbi:MAG: cephalosporin hydroxylase [Verrucomicrobiales bacterium]|nr:cephalosporin hydroxylase [Verrucomicrobiales bacterium]MBL68876.1 cephalosporin hydroxylase [Verrucomicrobiales bacterium]|tara:strand:+ start:14738 stop:15523 length:786 start_codon:yes stop_codon:yes gene_type:complete
MEPEEQFVSEVRENIRRLGDAPGLASKSMEWMQAACDSGNYLYNFTWLGRPIIQYPQDICAVQELIWSVKPDLVIETGIAHGGSLVLSASLLALLDLEEAHVKGGTVDPRQSRRKVLGIDIEIRAHNRKAIEGHPLADRIQMIEGSSIATEIVEQVREIAREHDRVMVFLDSNHTHDHVLAELEAYAPLVSPGSYCVVFDTLIENLPTGSFPDRPWDKGDNPRTAVAEFLKSNGQFEIDCAMENKLQITVAPGGFLKRVAG